MCLWNKSNNAYTDRDKRNAAWEEVAREAGVDVRIAERKIKSLKTQFFHYYKLTLKDQDEPYVPKWFAYSALQFLIESRISREIKERTINVLPNEQEEIKQEVYEIDDEFEEPPPLNNVEAHIQCSSPAPPLQHHVTMPTRSTKHQRYTETLALRDHYDSIDPTVDSSSQPPLSSMRDEFYVFAEYMADRLRRLPDAKSRLIAKHNIHNALFEVELKALESKSSDRNQTLTTDTMSVPSSSRASPTLTLLRQ